MDADRSTGKHCYRPSEVRNLPIPDRHREDVTTRSSIFAFRSPRGAKRAAVSKSKKKIRASGPVQALRERVRERESERE